MTTPSIRHHMPRATTEAALRRGINRMSRNINAGGDLVSGSAGVSTFARVYLAANVTLASGSYTDVSWDGESSDVQAMHSLVTNPERITVPSAGMYQITLMVTWNSAIVTTPAYRIQKNGSTTYTFPNASFASGSVVQYTVCDVAAAGDYYTVGVSQSSGSGKDLESGEAKTWVSVHLIGVV